MDASLRLLVGQIAAVLTFVAIVAFLAVPYALQRHPGEAPSADATVTRHMT